MATREEAKSQWDSYLQQIGGSNSDDDFENLWRQSADAKVGQPEGYGLADAKSWSANWSSYQPYLDARFKGQAGMGDNMTTNYTGGGGGGGYSAGPANTPQGTNSGLDKLMEQMIANQKLYADQAAQRDAYQRQWSDQMHSNIMDQYNRLNTPVDENDPRIAHQMQVYNANAQRALNQGREAMAARGAQGGTPQGASDAYLQSSYENLGRDTAGYSANLIGQEYDKRLQGIQNLLGLGAGVLTSDENRMMQDRYNTIDSQLKNLGIANNYRLGMGGLSNQRYGMDQQNQQFYDRMGYDIGLQEALMNQNIMSMLMR